MAVWRSGGQAVCNKGLALDPFLSRTRRIRNAFAYAPIFHYIAGAMTNATRSPLATIAALTALVLPAHAQHPTQPHPLVDRTVRVLAPSVFPERRTGRLSAIDDDWIWITSGGITVRVPRTAIETMEVGTTRGGIALRGGLVGAAIGAVAGGLFWAGLAAKTRDMTSAFPGSTSWPPPTSHSPPRCSAASSAP